MGTPRKLKLTYIPQHPSLDSYFNNKIHGFCFPVNLISKNGHPTPTAGSLSTATWHSFSFPKSPNKRKPDQQPEAGWVREGPGAIMGVSKSNLTGRIWSCSKGDGSQARVT